MSKIFFFLSLLIILVIVLIPSCVITDSRNASSIDTNKAFEAYLNLGLTYLQNDNREAARRHLIKALKLKPNSAPVYRGFGLLYRLTGEVVLAEEKFIEALKKDNDYTQGQVSYGHFLYEELRYQEAYNLFKKAAKNLSFQRRALVLTYLGKSALKLGHKIEAKAAFERAVNVNNKLPLPMIELGEVYYGEKQYAKSNYYLGRYVNIVGHSSKSLWLGIRIERILGNKDKEASYVLALKNLHPYSLEYIEYRKELRTPISNRK